MLDKSAHQEIWNQWNQSGGPKYPTEKIIQFVFRNFPAEVRPYTKVLDLGCGSGANTVFLAIEKFQVFGTDISEVGITNTSQRLAELNLTAELRLECLEEISFPDNFFDLVISCGVFECAGLNATQKAVQQVVRVLKPGGKGFFLFASNSDYRIMQDNPLNLHGFSVEELEETFSKLKLSLLYTDRYITTFQNQAFQTNDFLITIQK